MENGEITQEGTYQELLQSGTAFEQLVNAHKNSKTPLDSQEHGKEAACSCHRCIDSNNNYHTELVVLNCNCKPISCQALQDDERTLRKYYQDKEKPALGH